MSVQYVVVVAKGDQRSSGDVDAAVTCTVALDVVHAPGFDAAVGYMSGKVKVVGHTGVFLEALKTGAVHAALVELAGV